MAEPVSSDLSEMINGYIKGRPFQSLLSVLKNSGYNQSSNNTANIINSLDDSEYKSLKRHFNNLRKTINSEIHQREEQNESNDTVDSFLQFVSLLFDVSTIIQKRDEQTITNLKEGKGSQGDTSATKSKSKGDSDSNTKSTKDQSELISKLKRKLSKANEQITFLKAQVSQAKDEGKNEVIQDITDHYHLNQSSDIQNLISSLDNCIESNGSTIPSDSGDNLNENLTVLKKIVKSFDLPPETTPQNVVPELQQKMVEMAKFNAKMNSQLKEDIENAPIGPNEDPENPSIMRSQLVATINSLRAELDKARGSLAEQDEILQIFCNIPLKTNEIEAIVQEADNNGKSFVQKVRDIVSILAIQIFQSEDAETTNKRLFSLVAGLFQFINSIGTSKAAYVSLYSEEPFEEMRSVLLSQAERVHLFLSENGQAFTHDQQSLFDELITNNKYNPLKGIDSSSINSMNLLTHVKNFLGEYTRRPTTVEGQVLYVIALEAVCACDILQRYSGTVKHAFNRQIHESKQLKDYSIQLERSIEDQQIVIQEMSMVQNEDRNNRSENYEYDNNYYDNERESLSNSNSMNQVSTSLNQNSASLNQNSTSLNQNSTSLNAHNNTNSSREPDGGRRRRNRNENSGIRDSNSLKEKDENVRNRDIDNRTSKDEVNSNELNEIRSILRKGIIDHKEKDENCDCIENILEALDHLNQKQTEIVPDDRYIQQIQTQLRDTIAENKEWKTKNDNLIKETHNDIVNVQAQVSKMNEAMNKKIEMKKKQIQKLTKALKDARDKIVKLEKENQQNQEKLSQAGSQESEESSKQIAEEIQEHFSETKKEYDQVISQLKSKFEEKQKEFDSLKGSHENEINSLKQQLESEKEKSAALKKKIDNFDQSVKSKIEKLKKKEAKAIDQASILSQKYQELHKDFVVLENEKKAMLDKYENTEKEKSLIQASLKNYSETLEEFEKLRKSYDQLRNEKMKENQQFLSKIASLFPSYADFSVTISKDSVLEILNNVKEDLDTIPTIQGKTDKKDSIIQQIKESLNIESEDSIVEKLTNLIKTNNELDQSNHLMYSELKASQESRIVYLQLQDWLIRLYVMVTGGVCQDVTTLEMQHAIEDNITSKYENLILSRKNALLKAEKKLLLSKTFNKVNKDFIDENENEKEKANDDNNNNNNNDDKPIQNDEEEDQNQSSTEVEIDAKKNKENNANKKKKRKDKINYTFRHLLIMAMLICKAKRLSGNGEDPYGLEISDVNALSNRDGRQYSASLSPISKPMNNSNYVYGLD